MKAHRLDGISLTFGLLFAAFVTWWLLLGRVDVKLPALGWLVAGALILFGLLGLLGALRANRAVPDHPVGGTPGGTTPVSGAPVSAAPAPRPVDEPTLAQPAGAPEPPAAREATLTGETTVVEDDRRDK